MIFIFIFPEQKNQEDIKYHHFLFPDKISKDVFINYVQKTINNVYYNSDTAQFLDFFVQKEKNQKNKKVIKKKK